jgi:hypothetical protein
MSISTVTGKGSGKANEKTFPRVVACGTNVLSSGVLELILPKKLKSGTNFYSIICIKEAPLPSDGDGVITGDISPITIIKLDDRWTKNEEGNYIFSENTDPGSMKGFLAYIDGNNGGGEGSRDSALNWMIVTNGFDTREFI